MWVYFRIRYSGAAIPRSGPVLLVANHPNGLIDAAVVLAAARRPVRLIAKAPLLRDRAIGWLVRAVGAIPVYRPQDDPGTLRRNTETFAAVTEALHDGAAVALFPEGTSHSAPQMVALRTGAARMALASAEHGAFPIIPIGLGFDEKGVFRSDAHVVIGDPVPWADLARAPTEHAAVRELTARIERALRELTINLNDWADAPVIACAEAVYTAECAPDAAPDERHRRRLRAARMLVSAQESGDSEVQALAQALRAHEEQLASAGLTPGALARAPGQLERVRWGVRALGVLLLLLLGALGVALWYPPYRLIGRLVDRLDPSPDVVSTYKLIGALFFFLPWLAILAVGVGLTVGWMGGVATALAVPALGLCALATLEQGRRVEWEARRFLARRPTRPVATLRRQQRALAARLTAFVERESATSASA